MTNIDTLTPEPDDSMADLTDEQQIELIEQTDNGLTPEDDGLEQPDA